MGGGALWEWEPAGVGRAKGEGEWGLEYDQSTS
jgi:hypothetical protein